MVKKATIKWLFPALCIIGIISYGFIAAGGEKEIHWVNFDEAIKLNKKHPKKIFIDVYTSWCGWCKKMDATTYKDPAIISYMNKNFYAVRLDAETKDTFHFKDNLFINPAPTTRGSTNQLANTLLDNKFEYPTTVYMDENFGLLTVFQGYIGADDLKIILMYFGENKYKTMNYNDFKNSLQSNTAGK